MEKSELDVYNILYEVRLIRIALQKIVGYLAAIAFFVAAACSFVIGGIIRIWFL